MTDRFDGAKEVPSVTTVGTSPEAVERLVALYRVPGLRDDDLIADTLEALAARLKEVEAELAAMRSAGSWYKESDIDALQDRVEKAEAALAETRAETAAVIEAAAERAYQWWDDDDGQELREHIRSLTPAHATAALDEIKRQARAEALREAASLCQELAERHSDAALTGLPETARIREGMEAAFTNARYAILALIEKTSTKEKL